MFKTVVMLVYQRGSGIDDDDDDDDGDDVHDNNHGPLPSS